MQDVNVCLITSVARQTVVDAEYIGSSSIGSTIFQEVTRLAQLSLQSSNYYIVELISCFETNVPVDYPLLYRTE